MKRTMLIAFLAVTLAAPLGVVDTASAAKKKVTYEEAWKLCKDELDESGAFGTFINPNERSTRAAGCMKRYGHRSSRRPIDWAALGSRGAMLSRAAIKNVRDHLVGALAPLLSWRDGGGRAGSRYRTFSDQGPLYGSGRWSHALQGSLSCINQACAKEELSMGILDELLGGGQRQKEYRDFVDRYEQGKPLRATPVRRFSSAIVMCHTPCRLTSTLRRR